MEMQESHKLEIETYSKTKDYTCEEKFSLTSQIRRAALSVTSNIAEGFGRQSAKDKLHFYTISRGSILELQSQLLIVRDLKLLSKSEYNILYDQSVLAHKLINGLMRSIRNSAD